MCIRDRLSLGIALLISRQISKSLIRINESAKALAKGDFDVRFEGKDYREVAEDVYKRQQFIKLLMDAVDLLIDVV